MYWVIYINKNSKLNWLSFDTNETASKFAETVNGTVIHGVFVKEFK